MSADVPGELAVESLTEAVDQVIYCCSLILIHDWVDFIQHCISQHLNSYKISNWDSSSPRLEVIVYFPALRVLEEVVKKSY